MHKEPFIYLDSHATTAVDPSVLDAMMPYFTEHYGNAASRSHRLGWVADAAVENARTQLCALTGARPQEIAFTSGATEAINLALLGSAPRPNAMRNHIVTQKTEHSAVLACVDALEERGYTVTRLDVDGVGRVDMDQLREAVTERTQLVAIMLANNEVGTIQPIDKIGEICRAKGATFFCDLTQALGWYPINLTSSPIDVAAMSSHKVYGPKGVGALYVSRRPCRQSMQGVLYGGDQERGMRPGTLNVPGIVGFGAACERLLEFGEQDGAHVRRLRDRLENQLRAGIDGLQLNGCPENRHPGNLNIALPDVSAEDIMGALPNVACSTGSACTSASAEPSHVLVAMGADPIRLKGSMRFGIGKSNTAEQIDTVAKRLIAAVHKHRAPMHVRNQPFGV